MATMEGQGEGSNRNRASSLKQGVYTREAPKIWTGKLDSLITE